MRIWISLAVLLSNLCFAEEQLSLVGRLNNLAQSNKNISIFITHKSKQVIYDYQKAKLFIPASLQKLVLTAYFLDINHLSFKDKFKHDLQVANQNSDNAFFEKLKKDFDIKFPYKKISNYLKTFNVKENEFNLDDLSGISRKNQISCEAVNKILIAKIQDSNFRASLSRSGVNGTLKDRFINADFQVEAKTGSLKGIRNIAGYLNSKTNQEYLFCIINNDVKNDEQAKQLEEQILTIIWENA